MSLSVVQQTAAQGWFGSSQSFSFGSPVTAGNSIVLKLLTGVNGTQPVITDNQGNNALWTLDKSKADGGNNFCWIFSASNVASNGGTYTITVTLATSFGGSCQADEVNDNLLAEASSSNNGSSTSPSTGSFSPITSGDYVAACYCGGAPTGSPSGYTPTTLSSTLTHGEADYLIVSGTTAQNPTWTQSSASWCAVGVAYRAVVTTYNPANAPPFPMTGGPAIRTFKGAVGY